MKWRPRLPRSPRARKALAFGLAALLLAGAVAWLWGQRDNFAERLVERSVPADVTVSGLHLGNPLRLDYLGLRDPEDRHAPSLLGAEEVSIAYSPRAERKVGKVSVAHATLQVSASPETNFDFISRMLSGGDTGSSAFLPTELEVQSLGLGLETRQAGLQLEGLRLHGDASDPLAMAWKIDGEHVQGFWRADAAGPGKHTVAGAISLEATADKGKWNAHGKVDVPGAAVLEAEAQVQSAPFEMQLELKPGSLEGALWAQMLSDRVGYPVGFDNATVSAGTLRLLSEGEKLYAPEMSLDIATERLRLGNEAAPLYEGPLALALEGGSGQGVASKGTLRLGELPPLAFTVEQADGLKVTLAESRWDRAELETALPEMADRYLAKWPGMASLAMAGNLEMKAGATYGNATVTTLSSSGVESSFAVNTEYKDNPHYHVDATAKGLGAWTLNGAGSNVQLQLDEASARGWIDRVLGIPWRPAFDLTLSGTAAFANTGELQGDLKGIVRGAGGDIGHTLNFKGNFDSEHNAAEVDGKLALKGIGQWDIHHGVVELAGPRLRLPMKGSVDLGGVTRLIGGGGLAGKGDVEGTLYYNEQQLRVEKLRAQIQGLQLADATMPGDSPVDIRGDARLLEGGGVAFTGSLDWQKQLQVQLDGLRFATAKDWEVQELSATGSLALLVQMGLLEEQDSTFELNGGDLTSGGGGNLSAKLEGGFILPGKLLAAKGLAWDAAGAMAAGGVTMAGPLHAGELAAFGLVLSTMQCTATVDGSTARFAGLTCDVLGGRANGSADTQFMQEALPLHLDVQLSDVDLAEFTRVFQPPNVELTGKVNGRIAASIQGEQITALDVKLESGEGFTLNKAMVAQILMQQEVGGFTGSGTVSKIVEDVVGKEDKRPFTEAELTLGLEGGRITGVATLKSKALNLTVDIKADQAALFEAIKMRQEGQVANFTTTFH